MTTSSTTIADNRTKQPAQPLSTAETQIDFELALYLNGGPVPGSIRHGTTYTYKARGCRCQLCTAANTAACIAALERRTARRDEADFEHGPYGYTNWQCRCEVCREGNRERNKALWALRRAELASRAAR
jgi:hypothetical protein